MAFTPDGTKMYFVEQPIVEGEWTIRVHDLITKGARDFYTLTEEVFSLNVRGNFLSVNTESNEIVWDLLDGSLLTKVPSSTMGSALSPDGSDIASQDPENPKVIKVGKLCPDLKQFYNPNTDVC